MKSLISLAYPNDTNTEMNAIMISMKIKLIPISVNNNNNEDNN